MAEIKLSIRWVGVLVGSVQSAIVWICFRMNFFFFSFTFEIYHIQQGGERRGGWGAYSNSLWGQGPQMPPLGAGPVVAILYKSTIVWLFWIYSNCNHDPRSPYYKPHKSSSSSSVWWKPDSSVHGSFLSGSPADILGIVMPLMVAGRGGLLQSLSDTLDLLVSGLCKSTQYS